MTRIDLSSAIKVAVFENGFPRVVPILPKPGTRPKGGEGRVEQGQSAVLART